MFAYIRNKIHAYISGIVTHCVDQSVKKAIRNAKMDGDLADELAARFTAVDIAGCIDKRDIAQYVDMDGLKDYCAEAIDLDELAGRFSASEIASELALSDIASEIASDLSVSDIASEVEVDAETVAEHLDYRRLAMELLSAVKGGA